MLKLSVIAILLFVSGCAAINVRNAGNVAADLGCVVETLKVTEKETIILCSGHSEHVFDVSHGVDK